jgi:hypothetical protein
MTLLLQAQSATSRCLLSHSYLENCCSMRSYCIMSCYGQVDVGPFVIYVYLEMADLEKQRVRLKFAQSCHKRCQNKDILSSRCSKFRSCGMSVEEHECLKLLLKRKWTSSKKKYLSVKFPTCWEVTSINSLERQPEHGLDCQQMHAHEGQKENHENIWQDQWCPQELCSAVGVSTNSVEAEERETSHPSVYYGPGSSQRSERDSWVFSNLSGAWMWVNEYNPEANNFSVIEEKPCNALMKFQTVHLMK